LSKTVHLLTALGKLLKINLTPITYAFISCLHQLSHRIAIHTMCHVSMLVQYATKTFAEHLPQDSGRWTALNALGAQQLCI